MIGVRKLKLEIKDNGKVENVYKFIREEQYQQYQALNLGMTLLQTHKVLESFNSGAENKLNAKKKKLNADIEKLNKEIRELEKLIKKETNEKKIQTNQDKLSKKINKVKEYEKSIIKLDEEFKSTENTRNDIDVLFKKLYVKDLYKVLQERVNLQSKDQMSLITQRVKNDYKIACKNGLLNGDRSLTTYKRDFPLMVRGRDLEFYEEDGKIFIKWIKGIHFKVVIGRRDKNYLELQHTLNELLSKQNYLKSMKKVKDETNKKSLEPYKICDSSIQVNNKDIILNICFVQGESKKEVDFVAGRVVGVDLGINIPAYVSLNDVPYIKKGIGSKEEFLKVRTQMQKRRKRLQQQLANTKGGKGKKDKLKALNKFKDKERNFVRTYNHVISKRIVEFAIKNKAQQINIELLELKNEIGKESKNDFVLRNWSYFELQQMLKDKGEKHGIIVKTVDPYLTSQTCSKCGHFEKGQRETQENFTCKKCGFKANADYNASRNIAISENYITDKKESEYYKLKEKNKDKDYKEIIMKKEDKMLKEIELDFF